MSRPAWAAHSLPLRNTVFCSCTPGVCCELEAAVSWVIGVACTVSSSLNEGSQGWVAAGGPSRTGRDVRVETRGLERFVAPSRGRGSTPRGRGSTPRGRGSTPRGRGSTPRKCLNQEGSWIFEPSTGRDLKFRGTRCSSAKPGVSRSSRIAPVGQLSTQAIQPLQYW